MARGRRLRRAYNAVAVNAEDGEDNVAAAEVLVNEDGENSSNNNRCGVDVEATSAPLPLPRPGSSGVVGRRRRQYQTVRTTDAEDIDDDDDSMEKGDANSSTVTEDESDNTNDSSIEEETGTKVTIVILDPAQKKFLVAAYTHWTIEQFKEKGEKVHKVPPSSQRLIYRGQLLQDSKSLEEAGLTVNNMIVHLFPKPRVVIQPSSSSASPCAPAGDGAGEDNNSGAHIPQIILNADEAEQRATILVLGSADFLEAQNNVKLFSFLLLVISSIELFNLILILMGVPPDNGGTDSYTASGDDIFHINETDVYGFGYNSNNNNNNDPYDSYASHTDPYEQEQIQKELQTWHPRNAVDLAISALGVYVAMLGIRATNETTLRLAKQYLIGTIIVGVSWMIFNYWFTVHVDAEFDQLRRDERHNHTHAPSSPGNHSGSTDYDTGDGASDEMYDDDAIPYKTEWDYYQQNMSLMMIPGMVWILCCVRAWQFQSLLEEAEREAEERIRNELAQHGVTTTTTTTATDDDDGEGGGEEEDGSDEEGGQAPPRAATSTSRGRSSNITADLELQNTSAVIT